MRAVSRRRLKRASFALKSTVCGGLTVAARGAGLYPEEMFWHTLLGIQAADHRQDGSDCADRLAITTAESSRAVDERFLLYACEEDVKTCLISASRPPKL
jgi:hypothetical protein